MNLLSARNSVKTLVAGLQIPDSAYEKAKARYKDLGDWFDRPESSCRKFSPHIYAQGSFRLQTVVAPLDDKGDFDLDVGCRLRTGIAKTTHTQKQLKELVGAELEAYRKARNIEQKLDEKHRCWRLQYRDDLHFHMDVVPSIPEVADRQQFIAEAMIKEGLEKTLARDVAKHTGAITDNRNANYNQRSLDWRVSNSEGYALWFESRSSQARYLMEVFARAKVDELPALQRKSPLQACVQVLKRHRDLMFAANPDSKPISIIITTLAAWAYQGEEDVDEAMATIVAGMKNYIRSSSPRVPNPVNPAEDFADKWATAEGKRLKLEESFDAWLGAVENDFNEFNTSTDVALLESIALAKFRAKLSRDQLTAVARNNGLLDKAVVISRGARTSAAGVIGSVGVANPPHKFFGR